MYSNTAGDRDRVAEIIEVRGENGTPPYVVRYPDGRETLIFPGPDTVVEPARSGSRLSRRFVG
jgi:hypothetical protein